MADIRITGVPDDVRDALAARAARRGQTLDEYLLEQLLESPLRPTLPELLDSAQIDLQDQDRSD